jgi:hypothetical protein
MQIHVETKRTYNKYELKSWGCQYYNMLHEVVLRKNVENSTHPTIF